MANTNNTNRFEFTILNQEMIREIRRDIRQDNLNLPPRKNMDIPKDERWNTKKINSQLIRGLQNGDSINSIMKSMQKVIGDNHASLERNARTLVTMSENRGRFASYKSLSDEGIVIKKIWIATPDDRVRASHLDIDGEEQDIDVPFSNGCMYPGDGNGPSDEVWNCRCSMGGHTIGFKRNDGSISYVNHDPDETIHDTQMAQERGRRSSREQDIPYYRRIQSISNTIERSGLTTQRIMAAGRILAAEVNAENARRYERIRAAREELNRAGYAEIDQIMNEDKFLEAMLISQGILSARDSYYWQNNERGARSYYETKENRMQEIRSSDVYIDAYWKLERLKGTVNSNSEVLREMLERIRPLGMSEEEIRGHFINVNRNSENFQDVLNQIREMGVAEERLDSFGRRDLSDSVVWAFNHYPESWIRRSIENGDITILSGDRGFYHHGDEMLVMSNTRSSNEAHRCAIHELAHRFENIIPGVIEQEREFYDRRTEGEDFEWLGYGFRVDEVTKLDNFLDSYMGKYYNGNSYELASMGFELAFSDPEELAKDKEMQAWILGMLAVIP